MAANEPMRPVLRPFTVSREPTPSFSSTARSMPVMMVLKKLDVLKNCACACMARLSSGVPSPYILRSCGRTR